MRSFNRIPRLEFSEGLQQFRSLDAGYVPVLKKGKEILIQAAHDFVGVTLRLPDFFFSNHSKDTVPKVSGATASSG
jgi:hypothetical protein